MNNRYSRWLAGVTILLISSTAVLMGSRQVADDDFFAIQKNFEIFGSMFEALVGSYVDPVDAERLMRRGISAMLEELDPYTVFIDEADYVDANIQRTGRLGTVGLDLDYRNGRLTVLSPVDGGAAFRQGIRVGDVVESVDGRPASELTRGDVVELLSGEPGSIVRVVVRRTGEEDSRVFALVREVVSFDPIAYADFLYQDTDRAIAYVRLANFNPGSSERVLSELDRLQRVARPKAIILDLRDNQGGLLDAAVSITQLFVPVGTPVVSVRGRRPETYADFRTSRKPRFPDTPLFLLVNNNSASSSEIVAGAIQDLDRGIIIGETSFGKGLAQNVLALPFNTGLKITTSRFYSPSGRNVQAVNYRFDGSPTPDSLREMFATSNGRPVRGSGGVEPDVPVRHAQPGQLESALLQAGLFFQYADEFAAAASGTAAEFAMDQVDLDDFQRWLTRQNFSYETRTERKLEELRDQLVVNGQTAESANRAVAPVSVVIAEQKRGAFQAEADALRRSLFEAIVDRMSTDSHDRYRTLLPYDTDVLEALRLIDAPAQQAAILGR